jgi:hypothetical protein
LIGFKGRSGPIDGVVWWFAAQSRGDETFQHGMLRRGADGKRRGFEGGGVKVFGELMPPLVVPEFEG